MYVWDAESTIAQGGTTTYCPLDETSCCCNRLAQHHNPITRRHKNAPAHFAHGFWFLKKVSPKSQQSRKTEWISQQGFAVWKFLLFLYKQKSYPFHWGQLHTWMSCKTSTASYHLFLLPCSFSAQIPLAVQYYTSWHTCIILLLMGVAECREQSREAWEEDHFRSRWHDVNSTRAMEAANVLNIVHHAQRANLHCKAESSYLIIFRKDHETSYNQKCDWVVIGLEIDFSIYMKQITHIKQQQKFVFGECLEELWSGT